MRSARRSTGSPTRATNPQPRPFLYTGIN
jgi:hypothetical protein